MRLASHQRAFPQPRRKRTHHVAGQHELLRGAEPRLQVGLGERAGELLPHDGLAGGRRQLVELVGQRCARREHRRAGVVLVQHVDDGACGPA